MGDILFSFSGRAIVLSGFRSRAQAAPTRYNLIWGAVARMFDWQFW